MHLKQPELALLKTNYLTAAEKRRPIVGRG